MYKLNTNDYIQILNYYNIPIPKGKNKKNKGVQTHKFTKAEKKKIKEIAEKILAEKLCRCIKKWKTIIKITMKNALLLYVKQV